MKRTAILTALMMLTLFYSSPARAQQTPVEDQKELRKEIEALKEGQKEIQRELQEIKKLLLAKQAPAPAEPQREITINIDGDPFKGDENARLTLIEFSDYQCPFCSRFVRETFPQIERDYIKTGKIKYIFRDFPLESIHPNALTASAAANCAGEQGKYWEMHDQLFKNQNALSPSDMARHAKAIGADQVKFQQCLDSKKYEAEIRKKMAEGSSAGVSGTPSFLLGLTTPGNPKVKILRGLRGAVPYANFKEVIDNLLSSGQ
ncbi:MAG TPA: DsbA family protein [Pyrinomonadaceae bacterium]|nr:DsbA family protein [Pyrinomonadaceae bacterium]